MDDIQHLLQRIQDLEKQYADSEGAKVTRTGIVPGAVLPRSLAADPTIANGDLYYSNGNNFVRIPPGTNGQILTITGGVPSWQSPTVIGKSLNSFSQTILVSTFNSVANTTEQEITGLKVTLPIIASTCTVKVTLGVLVTYPNANNDIRIRMGTSTTATSNTEYAQTYGANQSIYTALVALASLNLSTQSYINITVQSDAAAQIGISAFSDRTQVWTEIYS